MSDTPLGRESPRAVSSRGGGFFGVMTINAAFAVATVPLLIHQVGASVWASLALGQTIGVVASIFVSFGWGLYGAVGIAAIEDSYQRSAYYLESFLARALLLGFVAPIYLFAAYVILGLGGHTMVAIVAGMTMLLYGLGGAWYFVGAGDPLGLLLHDALPRILLTAAGLIGLAVTDNLVLFVGLQLAGAIMAAMLALRRALSGAEGIRARGRMKNVTNGIRDMSSGMFVAVASTAYSYLPVVIVSAVAPTALPSFAFADKMQKYASAMLAPAGQTAQSYVPSGSIEELPSRVGRALHLGSLISVAGGVVFAVGLPGFAAIATGGQIKVDFSQSLGFGLIVTAVSMSSVVGLTCLVVIGQRSMLTYGAAFGLCVALPTAFLMGWLTASAESVLWTIAIAEAGIAGFQFAALSRWRRAQTS